MATLLEKALLISRYKYNTTIPENEITDEQIELVMAYINGDITMRQLNEVLDKRGNTGLYWVFRVLLKLHHAKKIKIEKI